MCRQHAPLADIKRVSLEAGCSLITAMKWAIDPTSVYGASKARLERAAVALGLPLPSTAPPPPPEAA